MFIGAGEWVCLCVLASVGMSACLCCTYLSLTVGCIACAHAYVPTCLPRCVTGSVHDGPVEEGG